MIKLNHASGHALAAACSAYALSAACAGPAQAARTPRKPTPTADLVSDFHLMAQQRPWTCPTPTALSGSPGAGWRAGDTSCAWQNRLSKRSWTWAGDASQSASPACVSQPARWWSWAQSGLPPQAARSVWQTGWSARSTVLSAADEQRLLVVRRERGGQWIATEWRWNPNPRPATRRWQQGRWQALVDAAARTAPGAEPQATAASQATATDTVRMQAVFAQVAGARPGEMGAGGMALETGGLCLQLANPQPGQSKLPLSYSPADSRLEQRAAMHLQLSRQLPGAAWLTPFKLLALPATPAAGAKFMATWIEGDDLKSQLWIPARTGNRTVRVRVSTRLAPGLASHPETAQVLKARQAEEHEIEAIASAWAVRHE